MAETKDEIGKQAPEGYPDKLSRAAAKPSGVS